MRFSIRSRIVRNPYLESRYVILAVIRRELEMNA